MESNGWTFDNIDVTNFDDDNFSGQKDGSSTGAIYATMQGDGTLTINYRNSDASNEVYVKKNGVTVSTATPHYYTGDVTAVVSFVNNDVIRIEESDATIQINYITMSCGTTGSTGKIFINLKIAMEIFLRLIKFFYISNVFRKAIRDKIFEN